MTWLRRRRSRYERHTDGVMGCRPQSYVLSNLPPTPRTLEMLAAIKAMPMEGVRAWTQRGGTTGIISE
jgi:hypothetical protein